MSMLRASESSSIKGFPHQVECCKLVLPLFEKPGSCDLIWPFLRNVGFFLKVPAEKIATHPNVNAERALELSSPLNLELSFVEFVQ